MFGGFRERADATYQLLQAPGRRSWSSRRPSGTRCARRPTSSSGSATEEMPLAGLVLNRVHTQRRRSAVGRARAAPARRRWTSPASTRSTAGAAAAARRPDAADRRASSALRRRFTAAHPRVPVVDVPAQPGTCTTWPACGRSARPRRRLSRPAESARQHRGGPPLQDRPAASACRGTARPVATWPPEAGGAQAALVLVAGGLEQGAPRRDVRTAAQQRPALTLGHAAPDAELDPVVQGVGQALGAHGAAHAHGLGPVLRCPLHEQRVRVAGPACPPRRPVVYPRHRWTVLTRAVPGAAICPRWDGTDSDSVGRQDRSVQIDLVSTDYMPPVGTRRSIAARSGRLRRRLDWHAAAARTLGAWTDCARAPTAGSSPGCCSSSWSACSAGVLVAGVALPFVGGLGLAARDSAEGFDALPGRAGDPAAARAVRILAADGSLIATFYDENRISVPLTEVAPVMRQAVVAIEDSRFYEHGGIDLRGTLRAFVNNQAGEDVAGRLHAHPAVRQAGAARGGREHPGREGAARGAEGRDRPVLQPQAARAALRDRPRGEVHQGRRSSSAT